MALAGTEKEYTDEFNSDAVEKTAAANNEDDFEFAPKETPAAQAPAAEKAPEPAPAPAAEPKKQSFKEAFAANRKAGNGTFEWNGKKFTTALATDKASGASAPKVATGNEAKHSLAAPIDTKSQNFRDAKASADMDKQPIVKVAKAISKGVSDIANTPVTVAKKGEPLAPAAAGDADKLVKVKMNPNGKGFAL
jgi:hypothetical protein